MGAPAEPTVSDRINGVDLLLREANAFSLLRLALADNKRLEATCEAQAREIVRLEARKIDLAVQVGQYSQAAKSGEGDLAVAKAEVERLREVILEAVTLLEEGGDPLDPVITMLADGRWPS